MKNMNVMWKIIKFNLLYLLLQLIYFFLWYIGVFNVLVENCYGSIACNLDLELYLQGIILIIFLVIVRKMFKEMDTFFKKWIHIFLSSITLLLFLNYLLYLIYHVMDSFIVVVITANLLILVILLLLSVNYTHLFQKILNRK